MRIVSKVEGTVRAGTQSQENIGKCIASSLRVCRTVVIEKARN